MTWLPRLGIDPEGLVRTVDAWNTNVAAENDPDFGRGASAYDGYWGDPSAATPALQTLGPLDTAPFYAVPVAVGAMGTKGGPRTDRDGRVLHVSGKVIPGLFAAGNAMAGRDRQGLRRRRRHAGPGHDLRLPQRVRRRDRALPRVICGVLVGMVPTRTPQIAG